MMQGGPLMHAVAGKAVALKEARRDACLRIRVEKRWEPEDLDQSEEKREELHLPD